MAPHTRCDGVTRRERLTVGALSAFGLTAAGALRARAAAPTRGRARACILLWLDGGPSHLDTFDPKPDAPSEVRGPFAAIRTALPGVALSEHLPRTAAALGHVALVRSLTHELGNHDTGSHFLLTGHRPTLALTYPSLGSLVARQADRASDLPPYVALPDPTPALGPGYLSGEHAPFAAGSGGGGALPEGLTLERLADRQALRRQIDAFSAQVEAGAATRSRDAFYERAYRLLASPAAKAAFALEREPGQRHERYGRGALGRSCLLARRLVEAGVPFVTVVDRGWDTHVDLARNLPDARFPGSGKLPTLDRAYSALLTDLAERGLLETTLVVLMGEFGRTPKINAAGGRDHWPRAGFVAFAGGGVRGGQVIGATDAHGESPRETPVGPADVAWSVLSLLGIDPAARIATPEGRPMRLLDEGGWVRGLV